MAPAPFAETSRRKTWYALAEDMFVDVAPTVALCSQLLVTSLILIRVVLLILLVLVYMIPGKRRLFSETLKENVSGKKVTSIPVKFREDTRSGFLSSVETRETSESDKIGGEKSENYNPVGVANEVNEGTFIPMVLRSEKMESVDVPALFPTISNVMHEESTAKKCSTGLTTRLLPFRNKNGDIEWAFTDEERQGHDDVGLVHSADIAEGSELEEFKIKEDSERILLTPTTSNSLHNDLILSKQADDTNENTPMTDSPFSESSEHDKSLDGSKECYKCPHCDSVFKIRGYLTRHLKKHSTKKAYKCPFYEHSIYMDENNLTHKCHPHGGFSRRDTYKTHLKLRHFTYPDGVKTKNRSSSPGYCGLCKEFFPNSEIWSEIHVEGGECKYLPDGFTGKLRIKNKIRKQQQKQKMKGQPVLMEAATAAIITALTLPLKSPQVYGTPVLNLNVNMYSNGSLNVNMNVNMNLNLNMHSNMNINMKYGQVPQRAHSPAYSVHSMSEVSGGMMYLNTPLLVPPFQDFQEHDLYDYDDEYCLDEDQLVQG